MHPKELVIGWLGLTASEEAATMTLVRPEKSHVFHRELDREYPVMTRGQGYRLYDDEGREYLDAVGGGAAVCNIGYGVKEVTRALCDQGDVLPFVHNQKFTHPLQENLAQRLLEHAPQYRRVVFCQGGGEANETALRLARSYHVERGDHSRWRVISVAQAYHGSTMATLSLTGRPALQYPYSPYLADFEHIPPIVREEDSDGSKALGRLQQLIDSLGSETIAAYFCEPVSAAAAPALRAPDDFYAGLAELASQYGFLVVFDEVVTGVGRTGAFFAADHLPIEPDIITTAKGLAGGYAPIGAVLATERIYEAVANGSRDFSHGYTFNGYPLGCAAAQAVLRYIEANDLIARVAEKGPQFVSTLRDILAGCSLVHEIRGEGFLLGVTYRDDEGRLLDPELGVARRIDIAALDQGLIIYSTQPTKDGYMGDQTMLAPAFTTSDEDFFEIAQRMRRALETVEQDIGRKAPMGAVIG
jgi:adenosylmethionine-8-amino-7-oxononanoate aminotransferase